MELLYQLGNSLVKVAPYYVYEEDIYEHSPNMYRLVSLNYLKTTKPIVRKVTKKHNPDYKYDKKTKTSYIRSFTLLFAPENYLLRMGYDPVEPIDKLQYSHFNES